MATGTPKPSDLGTYYQWLQSEHGVTIDTLTRQYYNTTTRALLAQIEGSSYWLALKEALPEFNQEFLQETTYPLLMEPTTSPTVRIKPFESVVDKSFRKNVLLNANWPDPPIDGWILPDNWLSSLNDILRTSIVAKYLDGVLYLVEKLEQLAESHSLTFDSDLEAREEGYYAAHTYVRLDGEIPGPNWDTVRLSFRVELQITTQLQEAIRTLAHPLYANRRSVIATEQQRKWQWEYESIEFKTN